MNARVVVAILLSVGCTSVAAPSDPTSSPTLDLDLTEDWHVVEQDPSQIVLRHRDGADGVRINLAPTAQGRWPGVAPILAGETWELRERDRIRPIWAVPFADRAPARVSVSVQGPDLLVRFEGPPLTELVAHPNAPSDPVLSWVRLRPRPGSWRIVLQGLHVWTVPSQGLQVREAGDRRSMSTAWGEFVIDEPVPVSVSASDRRSAWIDTSPAAASLDPYPRVGLTWTPTGPPDR